MRKFLFLDIDGVICLDDGLSMSCLENIRSLLSDVDGLEVVCISTRRADTKQMIALSKILGVDFVDKTPCFYKSNRSIEIESYLSNIDCNYSFVIIDDDINLHSKYFDKLILCNKYLGFTQDLIAEALKILYI